MNKLFFPILLVFLASCGNANNTSNSDNATDTVGLTNPIAIDTIKHPSGVDNSSVISTDTAAMNVQNTYKKADSIKK